MLDTYVKENKLAWDSVAIQSSKDFNYQLSSHTIEELRRALPKLNVNLAHSGELDISRYENLECDVKNVRKDFLDNGYGVVLITGLDTAVFPVLAQKSIYLMIGNLLGTLMIQNAKGEEFISVKDTGASMKSGGRYHQTKEGGSLHTDSPQFEEIPDYIGLLCMHGAKSGGQSRLISAYSVHNRMLTEHPTLLDTLYEEFHFDKRGDFEQGESPTTFQPIFKYDGSELSFRYLVDYIKAGHKLADSPLTDTKVKALNAIDRLLEDESLVVELNMEAGQIQFINNHRIVHGRRPFEDYPEEHRKRNMMRMWLKRRGVI